MAISARSSCALAAGCTAIVPNAYEAECVVDEGADGAYKRGEGPVLVIPAKSGRGSMRSVLRTPKRLTSQPGCIRTTTAMASQNSPSAADSIVAQFVAGAGTYTDHFTIGETGVTAGVTALVRRRFTAPRSRSSAPPAAPVAAPSLPAGRGAQTLPLRRRRTRTCRPPNQPAALAQRRGSGWTHRPRPSAICVSMCRGLAGPVTSAMLNMYANSQSKGGYQVAGVGDDTWTETAMTYGDAPAVGAPVGSSGAFASKTWTQVDVTGLVAVTGRWTLPCWAPARRLPS